MKNVHKERLERERNEYKKSQNQNRRIEELQHQLTSVTNSVASSTIGSIVPNTLSATQGSQVSQVTDSTMFGGRNEQAKKRGKK